MIADKFVNLYARNGGLRDKLVAERDVVLTYALRALHEGGIDAHLAFEGGTCMRETVFGSAGRFSEDLDFTLDASEPEDDVLVSLVGVFNRELHGITFTFDEYYKTDGVWSQNVSTLGCWRLTGMSRRSAGGDRASGRRARFYGRIASRARGTRDA